MKSNTNRLVKTAVVFCAFTMLITSCGSDEESSSSSQSASSSGISVSELATSTDNPMITMAVDGYRAYVAAQVAVIQAETKIFADAVRVGNVAKAKSSFPISRRNWERIEPIAGIIEDIDGAVDAREDDFNGPTDPEFTGWHRLEYHIFTLEDLTGAGPLADQLESDLQTLADRVPDIDLPPGVLTVGAQELIEEVAAPDGKLSGEEDRYSGTDLYDFKANVEGAEALVDLLSPALLEADAGLLSTIRASFVELNGQLAELGSFETGYVHYDEVTESQKELLSSTLGDLAESLSLLNGTLDLS